MLIYRLISALLLILYSVSSYGQLFGGGQAPLSVKWRQINHNGFQIIYPFEMEREAQRLANTLAYIAPLEGASLRVRNTSLPIVLQNRGVVANGYVALAPKRSEFNTTPPQQFDSQDWLNNLAVHELRHALQYDKLTNEKARPFPEEAYFAWMGVSIPLWFFEGDAVVTETALTSAGRGRQPSWIMPYRTLLLEGQKISYSRANFGSQRSVETGYYQLGYLLASQIRKEHGQFIFDSLLTDIRHRPIRPYPFAGSLKKLTGKTGRQWFQHTNEVLEAAWKKQEEQTPSTPYNVINHKETFETNYFLPRRLRSGKILALKESKARTAHFVLIDSNQQEKVLFGIGNQEQPWYSYANELLVWDEVRYDPRYTKRSYSVISVYDFRTGKTRKLLPRTRLFSPSLSPDGKKIVAVQVDLANRSSLVELDARTGSTVATHEQPGNPILQMPVYSRTGDTLAYVAVSEAGKSLWMKTASPDPVKLIAETQQQISRPQFVATGIAFNAHYSGLDQIHYLDIISGEISALTAAKYGAFNPTFNVDGGKFLFNNFSRTGYDIAEQVFQPTSSGENNFVFLAAAAAAQENTGNIFENIPDSLHQSAPYRPLRNAFNFHSLTPVVESEYASGLQLRSQNLLNTVEFFTGVNYHNDLQRFEYNAGLSLKSFYPVFNINYENRPRSTYYTANKQRLQGQWRENYVKIGATLPVNLNAGDEYFNFGFNVATSLTRRYDPEQLPKGFIRSIDFPLEYRLTLSHGKRQAERDVAPRWSQIFRLKYFHQPFDSQLKGSLLSVENFVYTPGLLRNHSFLVNFNYQKAEGVRQYNIEVNKVYGYNNILARSALKNTLLFNYRFPIAFPDWELGPLAYIKNIRGTLFGHYENIGLETSLREPKTYGAELRTTLHPLRYNVQAEFGTRMVFVNKSYHQSPILEFIFNYSF